MLHVFYGEDSFSVRQRLDELRSSLDGDGMLTSNTTVLDGAKTSLAEVTAACDTVPFLSAHRLVIVEGLLSRLGGAGRGRRGGRPPAAAAAWLPLVEYVSRMPPSTDLVLIDGKVQGENALRDALKGKGDIREFRPLSTPAVEGWVRRRAQSLGLTLSAGAVKLLVENVGNDLWAMAGELEKLSVYAGGRPVGEDDVRDLVSDVSELEVWSLLDAIVEGRSAAALKLLGRLFAKGKNASYILSMIQWQYRRLALTREMLETGATSRQIGERLGAKPFPVEKLLEQAPRYPPARLRAAFRRLLEADLHIKRGIYRDELALELLVNDLAAAPRPVPRA